jgi:putative hemin transport protein
MTRNDTAVIEQTGRYQGLHFGGHAGQTVGDLELRIFPSRWVHLFAVPVEHRGQPRGSLQVFDRSGTSVHKVFTEDLDAWRATLERWPAGGDTAPGYATAASPADRPDSDVDIGDLGARWDAMQDTHEFHGILREAGVGRLQALRLAGPARARRVATDAYATVLDAARTQQLPTMIFVANQGVVQIFIGTVGAIRRTPGWFNILERDFNLHVREADVASCWVVTKPTADGPVVSVEVFDAAGSTILQLFAKRADGQPVPPEWSAVLAALPGAG